MSFVKKSPGMGILRKRADAPPFIFRDEFSDDRVAGAVNGTMSTDGKATRTVVDTEGKLSIGGGDLVCAGGKTVPAYGDPGIWYTGITITRSAGVSLLSKVIRHSGVDFGISWDSNTTTYPGIGTGIGATEFTSKPDASWISTGLAAIAEEEYWLASILKSSAGAISLAKKNGIWEFLYTDVTALTPVIPSINFNSTSANIKSLRCAQLPAVFTDNFGLSTNRLAGARSGGDTFTHEADFLIEFTVIALPSANENVVRFRYLDSGNNWDVRMDNTGNLQLIERVGNTPTSRGFVGSGTVVNGNRIVIIAEGTIIKVYVNNVLKITYSSATNFATQTSGIVGSLGTGGAISDIVSWPRVLPSTAQNILNRYTRG